MIQKTLIITTYFSTGFTLGAVVFYLGRKEVNKRPVWDQYLVAILCHYFWPLAILYLVYKIIFKKRKV
jgi:hypothetical protein